MHKTYAFNSLIRKFNLYVDQKKGQSFQNTVLKQLDNHCNKKTNRQTKQ